MQDVQVVAVSTGSSGELTPGTQVAAETPTGTPNVAVQVIGPIRAISIRFAHLYFVTLVGIITGALAAPGGGDPGSIMPYADFADLVWKSAQMSLAVPGVGLLKDLVTIFGNLENKYPLATGNV